MSEVSLLLSRIVFDLYHYLLYFLETASVQFGQRNEIFENAIHLAIFGSSHVTDVKDKFYIKILVSAIYLLKFDVNVTEYSILNLHSCRVWPC